MPVLSCYQACLYQITRQSLLSRGKDRLSLCSTGISTILGYNLVLTVIVYLSAYRFQYRVICRQSLALAILYYRSYSNSATGSELASSSSLTLYDPILLNSRQGIVAEELSLLVTLYSKVFVLGRQCCLDETYKPVDTEATILYKQTLSSCNQALVEIFLASAL